MERTSQELKLTDTVMMATQDRNQQVHAGEIARRILTSHPGKYAGGKLVQVSIQDVGDPKTTQEWVEEIQSLFDAKAIQDRLKVNIPMLNGRLVLIGLCLSEPNLLSQFDTVGAFAALEEEIEEKPLIEILSQKGREKYELYKKSKSASQDSVSTQTDDPVRDREKDLLGRSAFARFLAERLGNINLKETGAYAVHLYAPWGAGKTSLLNFMHQEMESKNWLVVEFNAWRNQHIQPPWWSLLEQIYKDTKGELNKTDRFLEWLWRQNKAKIAIWSAVILTAWSLVIVIPLLRSSISSNTIWGLSADNAKNIAQLIALITTIWGILQAFTQSTLLGSSKEAKSYLELAKDPTGEIKTRFNKLVERLEKKKNGVAIFIDDLDRCHSDYVVDLLEGMQTLFREAPVVFLVAADRRWLNACYEQVYEKLELRVSEPGKSLGTLFLEKAFRFSTPLPGIPPELKRKYWLSLIQVGLPENEDDLRKEREQARLSIKNAHSEAEIQRVVAKSKELPSFNQQRVIREEAVVRLAAPQVMERIEHTLKPYADLLEPNPRAMKRLVNTYSANRALAILSEIEIELPQLVTWTILYSRWPQLGDYLLGHPEAIKLTNMPDVSQVPENILHLFKEAEVIQIVRGKTPEHPTLDIETVQKCALMLS